ncbi:MULTISPECIES: SpoIIE family protein phosphatase [unclassified Streptomyces]|uniref:SpoIIE family protein phosphatase n=1 Tax=unclassified Streptomyces TaxID=2593676 RepID=UPI002E82435D|nr:SpoIIE family protein phosphatase [Streptomyces sp. NBC_00562]WUC22782.1 SpoIIE family protein phosphatase [Streptomyces sp. NBC_00562]
MNARPDTSEPRGRSAARDARVVLDEQGAVAEWSAEAHELLGYPADEVLGRPVTALLSAGERSVSADLTEGTPSLGGRLVARHRNGHLLDVRAQVRLLVEDGTVRWAVVLKATDRPDEHELDTALLRALLTESPLGVQVLDPELRVVRLNLAAPGAQGAVGEEAIGRLAREVAPGVVDDAAEQTIRSVLETGDPVIDFEHMGRPPSDPDHDHMYSVTLLPLKDENGHVRGVCITSQDVTERHRAQMRLALLVEAGARIGTTLDVMTTAEELAVVSVQALADVVVVDVLDDVFRGEASPPGPVSAEALVRRAAFHAAQGLDVQPAYGPDELVPTYPPFVTACLADLQPRLLRDLKADPEWSTLEPHRAEIVRRAGTHSMMVVPLTARGVMLGMASFYRTRTTDPFDEDDLALATELATRAAVCIDNARQYTREHNAALILQRSLLPQRVPAQNAVEVAWRHEASGDVGDWFDVIPLSGARVALVVGHLVGQSMQAAAEMGRLRTAINTLAAQDLAPEELLAQLNDLATDQADAHTPDDTSATALAGATCVYAVYDPTSRRCTFARAGGLAPVIIKPEGAVELPDVPFGPPLGSGRPPYETVEVELPVGSAIVLSTSSLVQGGDPKTVPAGLRQILANPHRPMEDTCDAVVRAHQDSGEDSITLLLARTKGLGEDQVAAWTLPNDPAVVTTARTLACRQLANWSLEELEPTTELIVSELVTNAIRYASGPIHLRLVRDLTLICEVTDGSSTAPHLRHAYETDEGGRGLFLIAQLTRRWGTRYAARGKTIWAEQALPLTDHG